MLGEEKKCIFAAFQTNKHHSPMSPTSRLGLIEERRYYKALMTKVAKRCKNIEMYAAFNKWYELIDIKREKEQHKSK